MKKTAVLFTGAISLAVLLSACSQLEGKNGNAYLTVTSESGYSLCASFDPGTGLEAGWYPGYAYQVNPGSWNFEYALAYYNGTKDSNGDYVYMVNTYANGSYYWNASLVDAYYAAQYALEDGYYVSGNITIATNPGSLLFQNGTDRYYNLTLGWNSLDTYMTYANSTLAGKTVMDTPDKTVKIFTSPTDTITLTLNKRPIAGAVHGGDMNGIQSSAPASAGNFGAR